MKPLMMDIDEWRAMTEDERKLAIHNISDKIQGDTNFDNRNYYDEKNENHKANEYNENNEHYELKDIKIDGFNNIHIKLKKFANYLLAISVIICVISVSYYVIKYLDYTKNIDKYSTIDNAQKSLIITNLILSVKNTFIGVVSAFILYGFGEVIYRLIRIDDKLSKIIKSNIKNGK